MKTGTRLKSQVCGGEVIVVRALGIGSALECGGHPMVEFSKGVGEGCALAADLADGITVGKRYEYQDAGEQLEVLVTKSGRGSLTLGGHPLRLKSAKPLPASD